MYKKVSYKDGKLRIKFYSKNKDEFFEILTNIKTLFGRKFELKAKYWTAPPTKKNIEDLGRFGFDVDESVFKLFKNKEKIKIKVNNKEINIHSNVTFLFDIQDHFSCDDYSYTFVGGRFDKTKIIKKKFLRIKSEIGILPIGFLSDLINYLKENNLEYDIEDDRKFYKIETTDIEIKNCLGYLELYNYQVDAIISCLMNKNGIVKLPTGSGKTEIFLALCKLMNKKTLILFSRIDLARQTLRRSKKAGLDAGIVQGNEVDEDHKIIMCTIQSSNKLKDEYDIVIIDEVHNAKSNQYQKLLKKKNFLYRFGFSATPFANGVQKKLGNNYIKRYIGDIIYVLPSTELIEMKKIAKPKIKFITIEGFIQGDSWFEIENKGIINNQKRNSLIAELCNNKEKSVVLIKKIEHGYLLQSMIKDSIFLYGDTAPELKQEAINDFENGGNKTIIASTIFDEGINIKSIKNLILAGGGKSQRKVIQRLGRGLRITENKSEVNIYDFYDKANCMLEKHSKERLKFYKKEGFDDIKIS
jgi:superfamily II DNA or RNA helicase